MKKCPECGNPIYNKKPITKKERDETMECLEETIKLLKEEYDGLWFRKFGKK